MGAASDELIDCYQNLLLLEYEKCEKINFSLDEPTSRLTRSDIDQVIASRGITLTDLETNSLLVRYPDSTFRTTHFDLIYRAVHIRPAPWSKQIPLEFKIVRPVSELVPSFDEYALTELKSVLPLDDKLLDVIIHGLQYSKHSGIAHHQLHYLRRLLRREKKCFLIVAPTASGKSLIFYLAILNDVLNSQGIEPSTKALILYPRKALASDQLLKFLKVIYAINRQLGDRKVTIAVDDGDTPRSPDSIEVKEEKYFRGVACPKDECRGRLRYHMLKEKEAVVKCEKCGEVFSEIIATKEDVWGKKPDIVISNLSSLNRRMMMVSAQATLTKELKWVILDEAHVYREELGGHVHWLLRRLMARLEQLGAKVNFVISSATVPNPVIFASKLIGLPESEIYYESFEKIIEASKTKRRKISLHLIVAPNPLRSAESLAEELSLLLGVWCFANSRKAVVFVDNTAEVERLYNFVVNIIIKERAEYQDHLANKRYNSICEDIENPYSWRTVVRGSSSIDRDALAQIYAFHYADLPTEERVKVEQRFKTSNSGVLFSTSTLELGIDIGDLAAVIQYKVPMSSESYIQRIGRAGRSPEAYRVALGILVVTNSPSQVRYVLSDDHLLLVDPLKKNPDLQIPIAINNEEIKKQHMTYLLFDVLASVEQTTYIDYKDEIKSAWSDVRDVLYSLSELLSYLKEHTQTLARYAGMVGKGEEDANLAIGILERLARIVDNNKKLLDTISLQDIRDSLDKLHAAEDEISEALRELMKIRLSAKKVRRKLLVHELSEFIGSLDRAVERLELILKDLERLAQVV